MQMPLRLRSSEGKVLVAPAWDDRPAAAAATLPLETRVPLRALEKTVLFWVRHALVEAIGGGGGESLADDWDAHFLRCHQQDGLPVETVAAAVKKLRLHDALARVVPDFDLAAAGPGHRPSTSAAEPEPSASASHSPVACSYPEATTLRSASPDRAAAASRARRRRRGEDEADQEHTRSHRKTRQTASAAASATDDHDVRSSATSAPPAAAPAAKTRKTVDIIDCLPVPAPRKMTGPSLQRRRGLPELQALQVSTAKLPG